jgi:two-component system OmpR family sensor kinase
LPLQLRLGLWYGLLTGIVVIFVTLLTYALHTRGHYDDMDHVLVSVSAHVAEELDSDFATPAPDGTHKSDPIAAPTSAGLVLRIYGIAGVPEEASSNAGLAPSVAPSELLVHPSGPPFDPLVGLAPSFMAPDAGRGTLGLASDEAGVRWRLYAVPLQDGRVLLAALPLDRVDASVEWFRRLVPLLAVLGGGLALGAGVLLAGRALRPVRTLTDTAGAIERSRDFDHRVPEPSRNDELGRLARTFNAMLASLQQAYQAQKQFVADASHELRAPLTAIQGNLELVKRYPDMSTAERQLAIDEASREAQRLTQLVADLLALARADAGVPLRRERVELDRVLLDAVGQARYLAHGQRVEVDALEPSLVTGDPDRLKELALILLDNALKYTPPDGSVSVGLRRQGSTVVLEVHDTGIGIGREDMPRVFERFFRADPARRRDIGGTGLGLSIARWIADQHSADIQLSSELGHGTRVLVSLPLAA